MISSPPAPPITSFDPWPLLTKMEGTMEDGGRSPGTGAEKHHPHPPGMPPSSPSGTVLSDGGDAWGGVLASPPTLLPLSSRHAGQEALLSPGGGVSVEVGLCLRHKSSSSLLRRMPVPGEYTMAPKLQTGNVEPELDALALNNPGASTPKPCNTHGPQRSPLPVPPQDLAHGPPSNSFPQQGMSLVPDK